MSKSEMGGDVCVQLALQLNPSYLPLRRFTLITTIKIIYATHY